jgi:hypothetical protein
VDAAIAWLVSLLCTEAKAWGWAKAKDLVFGSPLERGLTRITAGAMSTAIAATLGAAASPEATGRMAAVLNEIWPAVTPGGEPVLRRAAGLQRPLLESVRSFVEEAMKVACTPVLSLSAGYEPTSSLASLAYELGTHIDETVFVDAFVSAWTAQAHTAALTDPALEPLVSQLDHEATRTSVEALQTSVGRQIAQAVQVLCERIDRSAEPRRFMMIDWFEFAIAPIDATMVEIYRDYIAGFTAAADGLNSRASAEELVPRLYDLRQRGLDSRINARALAIVLERTTIDQQVATRVVDYATSVRRFLNGADPDAVQTWYSYYIEQFSSVLSQGRDPHDPAAYSAAALPPDVLSSLRRTLRVVVDSELPCRFEEYKVAYHELKLACVASP